ncbi:MAG TPA: hypothetical protein VHE30_07935 [Polyangiaceae bacterium]|nr:hypothetical protein [Polyangiaceae bacterium]
MSLVAVGLLLAQATAPSVPPASSAAREPGAEPVPVARTPSAPPAPTVGPPAPPPEPAPAPLPPPASGVIAPPTDSPVAAGHEVPPPAPGPSPGRARWLVFKAAGGAFYSQIYAVHAVGGAAFIGLGGTNGKFQWDIDVFGGSGSTAHGLNVGRASVGVSLEWIFDRVRLGFRPSTDRMEIERVTLDYSGARQAPMVEWSLGIDVHASVDLVQPSQSDGLYLLAALQAQTSAVGPFLAVGYRFEAAH